MFDRLWYSSSCDDLARRSVRWRDNLSSRWLDDTYRVCSDVGVTSRLPHITSPLQHISLTANLQKIKYSWIRRHRVAWNQSNNCDSTILFSGKFLLTNLTLSSPLLSCLVLFYPSIPLTLDAILEYVTRYGFMSDPAFRINMQKTTNNGCKLKKLPYPASKRPTRNSMLSG